MKVHHHIDYIRISNDNLLLGIDGKDYRFKLADISSRLAKASESERNNFVVSASGYGISWPSIDEDISVDGLLGI
ncbi:MAG: DUF2442 domain-containing protein, partial [Calditrichaceae bacterium]